MLNLFIEDTMNGEIILTLDISSCILKYEFESSVYGLKYMIVCRQGIIIVLKMIINFDDIVSDILSIQ